MTSTTDSRADSGIVVHEFEKNSMERVGASLSTYRGHQYIDLRVFYEADGGEWRATKKGLTVRPEQLPELEEAAQGLLAAADPLPETERSRSRGRFSRYNEARAAR